jgi:hypothetical protein
MGQASGELALEGQADRAAIGAIAGREGTASALRAAGNEILIQRDPLTDAALAALLLTAEVGTDVVIADSVVVVAAEAAPIAMEAALPVALETAAPIALEAAAPLATEAVAASSSSVVSTTVAAVSVTSATLSSDSPTSSEQDEQEKRRRKCLEAHPYALHCEDEISMEEQVIAFISDRQGYSYESLGECSGFSSHGPGTISECNGAPGVTWHCNIGPYFNPISKERKPGGVVSIFGCECCRADGTLGMEWRHPHWSPGS